MPTHIIWFIWYQFWVHIYSVFHAKRKKKINKLYSRLHAETHLLCHHTHLVGIKSDRNWNATPYNSNHSRIDKMIGCIVDLLVVIIMMGFMSSKYEKLEHWNIFEINWSKMPTNTNLFQNKNVQVFYIWKIVEQ